MKMFGKKKNAISTIGYNPETQRAVLKCSICNGEQIAGFKERTTGHFTEVIGVKQGCVDVIGGI